MPLDGGGVVVSEKVADRARDRGACCAPPDSAASRSATAGTRAVGARGVNVVAERSRSLHLGARRRPAAVGDRRYRRARDLPRAARCRRRWRALVECVWTVGGAGRARGGRRAPGRLHGPGLDRRGPVVAGPDTAPHPVHPRAPGCRPPACGSARGAARPARRPGRGAARRRASPLADLQPAPARAHGTALGGRARAPVGRAPRRSPPSAARPRRPSPGVRAAAARLATAAPSAADVADALGWTTRTLHRRCLAAFGYGPAVLRRVLRFRRALALLRGGVAPADVAARAGYADQPHLSREVRALAGLPRHRLSVGRAAGRTGRRPCRPGRGRSRSAAPRTRRTAPARRGDPAVDELGVGGVDGRGVGQRERQADPAAADAGFQSGWNSRSSPRCRTPAAARPAA